MKINLKTAINFVIDQNQLPKFFSSKVLNEAQSVKIEIDKLDRKNLSELPFVTIDGIDAKDFDDAVYCKQQKDNFNLLVAIADVSLYVKQNSCLDKEAYIRGTSIYFPQYVIPMLPEELSNNLCSLKPCEIRPVLVADIKLNADGEIKKYSFYQAVIESKFRLCYEDFNEEFEYKKNLGSEIKNSLKNLKKLTTLRLKKKIARKALNFSTKAHKIDLSKDGYVKKISFGASLKSQKVIEECMLLANECAANFLNIKMKMCPYRIHEEPEETKIDHLMKLVLKRSFSNKASKIDQLHLINSKVKEDDMLTNSLILQAMQRAEYSTNNIGHFGLQLSSYCHFTSPIRRYPDLIAHRLIKIILNKEKVFNFSEEDLEEICINSSQLEQRAENASRQINQILIISFLEKYFGERLKGFVVGVTEFGLFVNLEKFQISGLLHVSDLKKDRYFLSNNGNFLYGEKTGTKYMMSQRLNVVIVGTSPLEGKLNLKLDN